MSTRFTRKLTEAQAAKMLGVSVKWLQTGRQNGGGPRFIKLPHGVRYDFYDVYALRNKTKAGLVPRSTYKTSRMRAMFNRTPAWGRLFGANRKKRNGSRELLTEKQVAFLLGVSPKWTQKARQQSVGPRSVKKGNRVLYPVGDVLNFIEKSTYDNTSQYRIGTLAKCIV